MVGIHLQDCIEIALGKCNLIIKSSIYWVVMVSQPGHTARIPAWIYSYNEWGFNRRVHHWTDIDSHMLIQKILNKSGRTTGNSCKSLKVLLAQFSLSVHKSGLKPDSFHFYLGSGVSLGCIIPLCKAKREYLLTRKVSRYCSLALHDDTYTRPAATRFYHQLWLCKYTRTQKKV